MKKGETWIVEIPGVNGHEQAGLRPAIIIADTRTMVAVIIPCTSNIQALRFPFTVRIEPTRRNGLDSDTIALLFQIRAIDKVRLKKRIGFLEVKTMREVDKTLKILFGLQH
jgi:mRNA interferase MazF